MTIIMVGFQTSAKQQDEEVALGPASSMMAVLEHFHRPKRGTAKVLPWAKTCHSLVVTDNRVTSLPTLGVFLGGREGSFM